MNKNLVQTMKRLLSGAVPGLMVLLAGCQPGPNRTAAYATTEKVGRLAGQRHYTPANQVLSPAGAVELPGMRPPSPGAEPGRALAGDRRQNT
jgi:hypothetical protein